MAVYYKSAQNNGPVNILRGKGVIYDHPAAARMTALALQTVRLRQVSLDQATRHSRLLFPEQQFYAPRLPHYLRCLFQDDNLGI